VAVDAAEATRVTTELGPDAVIEVAESGDVVVRMEVTDVEALISWVLGFLEHAEVLRPLEVRNAVISRLEAFATSGGAT
jgi:predicted DNA-binding transcriptional regulator YafY